MNWRSSLSAKILITAFVNILLLGVVIAAFARLQLQLDLSSFLLAPTRDRILSVSRLIALELPNKPQADWTPLLDQYSATYPAKFYLFDSHGNQIAGAPITLPKPITDFVSAERDHPPGISEPPPPPKPHDNGKPGPPPNFVSSKADHLYWVATHFPIWREGVRTHPIHGNLVWVFPSLWTNSFFFDYRPWLLVLLAVIVVSLICWVPLIRGLTRSIAEITHATGVIAEGHFEIAVTTRRRDELGQLSHAINRMAERLLSYVHGQKRFLSDVAHELCSPIARMQMALGILEQRAHDQQKSYVSDLQEEVEHMSGLINQLLSFSKAEINPSGKKLVPVNVAATVQNVLEREDSATAVIDVRVEKSLEVLAQPEYLFRSIANLVRNAIRYAGHAGPIVVSATNGGNTVSIVVADEGPGVPESELEEIFKPFYRPEFARQRETGGTGLGLAIVKSCVEACNGTVHCRNKQPHGLRVEILLPASGIA